MSAHVIGRIYDQPRLREDGNQMVWRLDRGTIFCSCKIHSSFKFPGVWLTHSWEPTSNCMQWQETGPHKKGEEAIRKKQVKQWFFFHPRGHRIVFVGLSFCAISPFLGDNYKDKISEKHFSNIPQACYWVPTLDPLLVIAHKGAKETSSWPPGFRRMRWMWNSLGQCSSVGATEEVCRSR